MATGGTQDDDPGAALADLYHAFFTGLVLSVVTRRGERDAARFVHAVFRHQHEELFLPGLAKLGLENRPPAVACAAYHYLSNRIGGVPVEFIAEGEDKAWVVFPPPRWIWAGTAICAVPSCVARGMLTGWYARNGPSLGVHDLRFTCTAQLVDGDFGLAGYFERTGRALSPDERLAFRPGHRPPRFDPNAAPRLGPDWTAARLARARMNYAAAYVRSALPRLAELFGTADGAHLARLTGRLVGAQFHHRLAGRWGIAERTPAAFAELMDRWARLEGDTLVRERLPDGAMRLARTAIRPLRRLPDPPQAVFDGIAGLVEGLALAHDRDLPLTLVARPDRGDEAWGWRIPTE